MLKKSLIIIFILSIFLLTISNISTKEESAKELIQKADKLYEARHQTNGKYQINVQAIKYSMAFYQKAFGNDPRKANNQEASYKYLRCVYFFGNYVKKGNELKKFMNDKYNEYAVPILKKFPKCGEAHYWASAILGRWSYAFGIMEAAKAGIGDKIKKHCEDGIKYAPKYEGGGAYRVLARLHYEVPSIAASWKSYKKSQSNYETALKYSKSGSYLNKHASTWYAELLFDNYSDLGMKEADAKKKAKEIIQNVIKQKTDKDYYTEDIVFQNDDLKDVKKKLGIK